MSKKLAKKLWIKVYVKEFNGFPGTAAGKANEAVDEFNKKFKETETQNTGAR